MKHLYKTLSLNNFTDQDIQATLEKDLNESDLNLTFRWTNKKNCVFYKLHLKFDGKIVDLLSGSAINSSNGAYTFHIGSFKDSAEIEISFGLLALVSIPKLLVILSQTNPSIGFQVSPTDPSKTNKVDSGSKLEETIKYKIQ